ncbi:MAG: hypothetical protein IPQ02_08330 [Saprospiraceae bacterium]|nr:hypothetical protein [Candidatus Defluviibacterium haderslevense]
MKIKYQDKIVAFIDVLGFSNLVYTDTTFLISKYFDYVLGEFKNPLGRNKFSSLLISDSIVITANNNKENLATMVEILCLLQSKLMTEGILIRGAISFGGLYLNKSKNIIVGVGMINAYQLESKAIYPRIILDRRLINCYFEGTSSAIRDLSNSYFSFLLFTPPQPYSADFLYLNYTRFFSIRKAKPLNQLLELLKNHYYYNEHIEKSEWLRKTCRNFH